MGRPKLPRTKEQIAIRLLPGTKARLAALVSAMTARGKRPVRSDVLRDAIERGLSVLEAEAQRPAAPTPTSRFAVAPQLAATLSGGSVLVRARPAPPPPRMPTPAAARSGGGSRKAPIPGTLADRAWNRLREMSAGDRGAEVSIPQLCRGAWPPNPARVRDALRELVDLELVELRALPSGVRLSPADRELVVATDGGALMGLVRQR